MVQRQCLQCSTVAETDKTFCPECGKSYFAPPSTAAVQPTGANGFAIASMVLGIVWIYWIGSILAVVFGHISLGQINSPGNTQTGRGMAIAGLVLGYIGVAFLCLFIVVGIASL